MASDLPFQAEYAKSNRSSCKACKQKIDKDSLRIAKIVQSPHFDGKVPNWFHFACFFTKKFKKTDVSEFNGFDLLRWDDQEKIKKKLMGENVGICEVDGLSKDDMLVVEYAKSNRSFCKCCEDKITKGEVRIGKSMEPSVESSAFGRVSMLTRWFHVDCFVEKRCELNVAEGLTAEMIPGFSTLNEEDQMMLKTKLGTTEKSGKKRKATGAEKQQLNKKMKEEKAQMTDDEKKEETALKAQSKRLWKIRDSLKNYCSVAELKAVLAENDQKSHGGENVLLDRCTDGLAFGALKRCNECKDGHFSIRNDGYYCTGNITEWTKCTNVTKDPERTKWIIPEEVKENHNFLKKFKLNVGKRLFPRQTDKSARLLSGLAFSIIGKLETTDKASAKTKIEELGGKLKNKISGEITCCISTAAEVSKKSKKIQDAEKAEIPVVSEEFLQAVHVEELFSAITKHALVTWGTSKSSRQPTGHDVTDGPAKKRKAVKSQASVLPLEKKVKLSVKGGGVVDPDSGMSDSAHVYEVSGQVYNAVLGIVDITRGTNSYYKLQILKNDIKKTFFLFRSWGRVGTTIGGKKLESFGRDVDDAIARFEDLYLDKTGNDWKNRKNFVKQAGKFYPLEIDYRQEDNVKNSEKAINVNSKCTLPISVQKLVQMIFDIESMKKAMLEFEIDLKKMPLGKLSRKQIESGYAILNEAQKLIETQGSKGLILDASNRFYTLIPHDFGMKKPPLLDNLNLIKNKVEMLENLLDIEVAYSLIKETTDDEDPLDAYYKKLNSHIKPINKDDDEYDIIQKYVRNTHASTHRHYRLEIEEIFKIDRESETKRYKPFKELPNRRLLWHGSRTTNFAGILSQGLRIAPPEAPVTGYMFGKGIYFADMVSKSANYCNTTYSNPVGLMLLCEVALGNMHELTSAKFMKKLPAGKHSVKGCGRTAPDPTSDVTMTDGTIVPCGKGIDTVIEESSLLYNEYIVYDVAQVNMKYLLQLKFNYE